MEEKSGRNQKNIRKLTKAKDESERRKGGKKDEENDEKGRRKIGGKDREERR